jgi:hypothetical protein
MKKLIKLTLIFAISILVLNESNILNSLTVFDKKSEYIPQKKEIVSLAPSETPIVVKNSETHPKINLISKKKLVVVETPQKQTSLNVLEKPQSKISTNTDNESSKKKVLAVMSQELITSEVLEQNTPKTKETLFIFDNELSEGEAAISEELYSLEQNYQQEEDSITDSEIDNTIVSYELQEMEYDPSISYDTSDPIEADINAIPYELQEMEYDPSISYDTSDPTEVDTEIVPYELKTLEST